MTQFHCFLWLNNNPMYIWYTSSLSIPLVFKFYLFLFTFGAGSSLPLHRLSLGAVIRVYSSSQSTGFSLQWLLSLQSTGSSCVGFSSCSSQAHELQLAGSVVVAHGLSCSMEWESSRIRDQTHVPCIGRPILNQWTAREVLSIPLLMNI